MLFHLAGVAVGYGNDREQSFGLTQLVMSTLAFGKIPFLTATGVHQIPWKRSPQIAWKMTTNKLAPPNYYRT